MELVRRPAPYRIETENLVLRCWRVEEVPQIHEAVAETVEELRPWMPWAEGEPASLEERVETIRTFCASFSRDEEYLYGVLDRDESRILGGMGLHPRVGPGGIELGYWIRTSATGRGVATEGAAALIRASFECIGVDRVEIRIEPGNEASHRVVEKLKVPLEATLRRRFPRGGELRDIDQFTMFAGDYPGSFIQSVPARFLDALGRPLDSATPERARAR